MANWLSRKTELINETDEVLQVKVHREDAPEGYSDLAICLKPHKHKDIRSTKFLDDDDDSGRVSVITVERKDGDYLRLTADDFVSNIRLIFHDFPGNQSIAVEPGGQFEHSGAPLETLHQIHAEVGSHLYQVQTVLKEIGIGLLDIGYQPKWEIKGIPLMPKLLPYAHEAIPPGDSEQRVLKEGMFGPELGQQLSLVCFEILMVCLLFNWREMVHQLLNQLRILVDECKRTFQPWVMKRETVIGKKNCHQILTEVGLRNLFVPSNEGRLGCKECKTTSC